MKLKIVNVSKFIRSIIILIGVIICISIFAFNTSLSHKETTYKTVYVANGDTLWDIAKNEKENNNYYENKDIRYVVDNIKTVNKLSNSDLTANQELIIPLI